MTDTRAPIPLLVPALPRMKALAPYLQQIDDNRFYTNFGPLTRTLETRLAEQFQQHTTYPMHVATTSSATTGLELALTTLNLPRGSRVAVPALTFVATLTAVIRAGHIPVVMDVDAQSWMLTPDILQTSLTKSNVKAAIVVAAFGQPVDTTIWSQYQATSGIQIIVDAAGGFGSQWVQAPDISVVFSMHATKSLAAGEGGFVVCGDHARTALITELSNFGMNLDPTLNLPTGYLTHAGGNAKLSEYHAAVALASLDAWEKNAQARHSLYARYQQLLMQACGQALHWQEGISLAAPNMLCVRMGNTGLREQLENLCKQRRIATRRWYQPLLHQHASSISPLVALDCPNAEAIASDLIGLPFFIGMDATQLQRVVEAVQSVILQQDHSTQKVLQNSYGQYSDLY